MTISFRARCLPGVLLLLLVVAAGAAAAPQEAGGEASRPRVGLVLGGGGARGAAHIGVLKELERQRIPVDVIAGTSMGAIVGGLYASGMRAAELEELVGSLDWAAALSDAPSRDQLSFRRKQDDAEYPIDFELGLRGTDLLLPQGVIHGQKLDLLLRELTVRVSDIEDFDDLPIPFRAIASDIERGEAYVMGEGDLAAAIRASMSVPGVFAPVEVDGRLLVDGGLVGNLPIDEMRKLDVDVIIAVDVEFPLYPREDLGSVLTISEQMLTILVRKETLRQIADLGERDVLIRPELGLFGSTNFGEIMDAVAPGERATREQAVRLAALALDEVDWENHLAGRRPESRASDPLEFVRVVHDGKLAPEVLASRLDVAAGDPADPGALAENANRLYGLGLFQHVGYRLVEEQGRTGVEYHVDAKTWGPNFLQFGIALEDDLEGSTAFNLSARMTRSGLNRYGAEWRTDLALGTDPLLFTEFYQPLPVDPRFFVAPRFEIRQNNFDIVADNDRLARLRLSRAEAGLDIGREIGNIGEFRTGLFRGLGDTQVTIGDPLLPDVEFDAGGAYALLRFDTQDNVRFPHRGTRADLRWTLSRPGLGADSDFDTIEGELSQTWTRGKSSLQLALSYATTLDSDDSIQDYFPLGGFLRLSGLEHGAISGPHAALSRVVYYRRIGESSGGVFDMPIYLGMSAEAGNVWQARSDIDIDSLLINGSVFAGVDTFIGPVYLAAGFGEDGESNFYLFIGSSPR